MKRRLSRSLPTARRPTPGWSISLHWCPHRLGAHGHQRTAALAFRLAHAHTHARDAAYPALETDRLLIELPVLGLPTSAVRSQAGGRSEYIQRSDWGRQLVSDSRSVLAGQGPCDVAVVLADGLSATVLNAHAALLLARLPGTGFLLGPLVLAEQACVALGDETGQLLVLGQLPGLSAPDNLGAYLTHGPWPGLPDAVRNGVSNIRPAGLGYAAGADTLLFRCAKPCGWARSQPLVRARGPTFRPEWRYNPAAPWGPYLLAVLMNEHVTEFLDRYPAALAVVVAVGCAVGGGVLKTVLFGILQAYERRQDSALARSARTHLRRASAFFFPVLLLVLVLPLVPLDAQVLAVVRRVVDIAFIGTFAWGLVGTADVAQDLVLGHYQITGSADNLRARKLLTQLQFVKKVLVSLIVFVAAALVLMSFATVRRVGTGLLASAGIASVVVGFAAQRSLSNLLAGFQIAFTQPLRLDDVLVVEGEWGRVEEITFTYVVLRIWDERRLVLPLTYFIEKPFQNWTRSSSQLLGTVFLYVDHSLPVAAVRVELQRILAASPRWDGRVAVLQVTDVKERTVELRALMSAVDSSTAFDLRCEVREQLVAFVQQHYPESLPKTRALVGPEEQFQGAARGAAAADA